MKCLIINGSPRKGNTWKLACMVKDNLQALDENIEIDEIHLKDVNLPLCSGCSQCFRKGHIYCPHHEIMQKIMNKIEECDGVIFAAASFQMHVPALTKNFTDHMCFMLHRPRYFDKKALVVSTTGGVGAKGPTKFLAGTLRGWGFNRCYQLSVSAISWNDYKPTLKDINKCRRISKKFYDDLSSRKLHSPKLSVLIPFNLFRGMSDDYKPGTEFETQDGIFWDKAGLAKYIYSPQVPLPFYKRLFGSMLYILAKKISKYMIVTYKKKAADCIKDKMLE